MHVENIIIGAGPSSLQLAYYFKKYNIPYLIIEKENTCASFFLKYPHSKKLISLNKKNTGKTHIDFNLRHDWNSLLNDDNFLFTNFSDELYPSSTDLYLYLNEFSKKYELNISFNTTVNKITKHENVYKIITNNDSNYFTCTNLIIATGLTNPKIPTNIQLSTNIREDSNTKIKHYADFPNGYFMDKINLQKYINKKILIIGGGNSGYELANLLQNYCSHIIIFGNKKPLSIVSHYVGDIRSIYMPFLDTFYLKSLNGIDENTSHALFNYTIEKNLNINDENYGKFKLFSNKHNKCLYNGSSDIEYFDEIIYCSGWQFDTSMFDFNIQLTYNKKFPKINYNYESINNKNIYFIGSLMHSKDFKKSSGGFIHGFRYLLKLFVNLNYNVSFTKLYFKFTDNLNCYTEIANHIYNRINFASSIYQLHSVLCDIYYFDTNINEIVYIEDITFECIKHFDLSTVKYFNVLYLEYGKSPELINKLGDFDKYNPTFLHPKIYCYENHIDRYDNYKLLDRITFEENLIADFKNPITYHKIKQTLKISNLQN
jgi:thioredoxin reductase